MSRRSLKWQVAGSTLVTPAVAGREDTIKQMTTLAGAEISEGHFSSLQFAHAMGMIASGSWYLI
jgi:hypothetical protein